MSNIPLESSSKKNILMSPNSFVTLRRNLIKNIGIQKTNSFLFHFGKEMGESAAKEYFENNSKILPRGKRMHVTFGHVKDIIYEEEIEKKPDGTINFIKGFGKWIESFEAEVHVKNDGLSSECVCHTLSGFASGAFTYEFGQPVITIETKCVAKGDPCCEFEIRQEKDWLPDQEEMIKLYQDHTILSELEMTYDALLHHKQLIEHISNFHYKLTQSVTEKHSLEQIIQSAYQILQIPILIEDTHGHPMLHVGFTPEQLQQIEQYQHEVKFEEKILSTSYHTSRFFSKLSSSVLVNKKHQATCSFFYFSSIQKNAKDHFYLEIISTVTALCLLYEAAQFEEQQRMKQSILDRLIHKQYQSIKDLVPYFKFFPFQFQPPFSTAVVHISHRQASGQFIDLYEQLLQFSRLFNQNAIPTILAITGEEIVLLNANYENKKQYGQHLSTVLQMMEKQNKTYEYTVGISNSFHDLADFESSLKKARISQKFPNKQMMTNYEDLGILGDFVTNMSVEQLHEMAKNMLKELYDFQDARKRELLYTLYRYLSNGQKLKDTMEELSLSIGGIQYRIKQIELMIQKSLKNASNAAYILLMIEALILLGELQFEE